jgi:NAD-dependent dihydropyrimidine dehydrogenase PreA subunit
MSRLTDATWDILDFAGSLFDVIGITKQPGYGAMLVVGLESTPERNLDEFGRENGELRLYGFEKHMSPLLESALGFIRGKGYSPELVGKGGYPRAGQLNLKELVVQMGLGKRGKHTVVLHDKYGARLRFAAIKIGASSRLRNEPAPKEPESAFCHNCSLCIEVCPVGILEPYSMADISRCLSRIPSMKEHQGRIIPCDECLKACPAGSG